MKISDIRREKKFLAPTVFLLPDDHYKSLSNSSRDNCKNWIPNCDCKNLTAINALTGNATISNGVVNHSCTKRQSSASKESEKSNCKKILNKHQSRNQSIDKDVRINFPNGSEHEYTTVYL